MAMLEILLLATTVFTAGAGRCTEPPRIASGVAALHGQVVEAESFTVAELRDMARQRGAAMAHAPLGFYAAKFGHGYQVHTETQASADGTQCGTLTTVTVRLVLIVDRWWLGSSTITAFATSRAGSSADRPLAICFRCCSRMAT